VYHWILSFPENADKFTKLSCLSGITSGLHDGTVNAGGVTILPAENTIFTRTYPANTNIRKNTGGIKRNYFRFIRRSAVPSIAIIPSSVPSGDTVFWTVAAVVGRGVVSGAVVATGAVVVIAVMPVPW
jgi:hypothetical protein